MPWQLSRSLAFQPHARQQGAPIDRRIDDQRRAGVTSRLSSHLLEAVQRQARSSRAETDAQVLNRPRRHRYSGSALARPRRNKRRSVLGGDEQRACQEVHGSPLEVGGAVEPRLSLLRRSALYDEPDACRRKISDHPAAAVRSYPRGGHLLGRLRSSSRDAPWAKDETPSRPGLLLSLCISAPSRLCVFL
jgi:hypothetical protein